MRKFIPIFVMITLLFPAMGLCQDLIVPLPQGEGYAVKKAPPSANSRWELKLINQSSPMIAERPLISPSSFYLRDKPEEAAAAEAGAAPQATPAPQAPMTGIEGMGMQGGAPGQDQVVQKPDEKSFPIKRIIKSASPDEGRLQVTAFMDAYNQVLLNSPPDEPIEFIIDKAAWQYWYNQVLLWEEYVEKNVFLNKTYASSTNKLDFTSADALKNSLELFQNDAQKKAETVIRQDHMRNLDFLSRLDYRDNRRKDYAQWLEDQKSLVVDFTRRWARKENEQEINIDGTIYLLSEEPLDSIPRNSVNLVTKQLTPYDLLNADGTLKKPLR